MSLLITVSLVYLLVFPGNMTSEMLLKSVSSLNSVGCSYVSFQVLPWKLALLPFCVKRIKLSKLFIQVLCLTSHTFQTDCTASVLYLFCLCLYNHSTCNVYFLYYVSTLQLLGDNITG